MGLMDHGMRISSASTSVLVNGSPTEEFRLERGLRQGGPLSPFLFLIAVEGISILMNRAINQGLYVPKEIGRHRENVSHLQFANDTIFLGKESVENVWFLKRFLRVLEFASGLKVNSNKYCLYGINVSEEPLSTYAGILGCLVGRWPFTYLGVKVGTAHRKALELE